jgi:hypothetical protein
MRILWKLFKCAGQQPTDAEYTRLFFVWGDPLEPFLRYAAGQMTHHPYAFINWRLRRPVQLIGLSKNPYKQEAKGFSQSVFSLSCKIETNTC